MAVSFRGFLFFLRVVILEGGGFGVVFLLFRGYFLFRGIY